MFLRGDNVITVTRCYEGRERCDRQQQHPREDDRSGSRRRYEDERRSGRGKHSGDDDNEDRYSRRY